MNPKRPNNFYLILMLGSLTALSPFSIDMYLPAFPKIASDFGVSVTEVSLSLSSYFIGLACGQLFYGPLLDRFGRKPPLYGGLILYILATLGCMLSRSIESLVAFRCLQALGGCAAQVASVAMVRDFFEGREMAKIFSLLVLILGVSPLLAPTTGAYLAEHYAWHSVFIALLIIGCALLAMVFFFLPEGHQPDKSQSLRLGPIFKGYFSILSHPRFYTYTFAGALAFSGLFVYLASSPVVFLEIYKVPPETYGWIFGMLAAGLIGCSQLNILLMRKFSSDQILVSSLTFGAIITLIFMTGSYLGVYGLFGTILLLFLYLSSAGLVNPNAASLALAPFGRNAGSASALMGSIQMTVGAIASTAVGLVTVKEMFPFTVIFAIAASLGLAALLFGKSKHDKAAATSQTILSEPESL
ncbi:MAG: multidrug effflux MFS transporter [Bdellovibrionales bacterium]|nr:multidrug effflux MFS transporter [Bdellovibrionales bacterium]